MIDICVESFDAIDLEAYALMQRHTFDELLAASGVSSAFMKPDFYLWKYDAPAGKSKIALAMDGNTILASNAMVPYFVRSEGGEYVGWQSVDTATIPKARGKGLFLQCVRALREGLASEALFFGYPNKDSLRGFQRLGWVKHDNIDVWLSNSWWPGSVPACVRPVSVFDAGFDRFTDRLTKDGYTAMVKNAAFMNWRFNACPVATYESFAFYSGPVIRGVLVVREARVKGRNICLVMDLRGESRAICRVLAAKARQWARRHSLYNVIFFDNRMSYLEGVMAGFMRVPTRLLPKQQILMGEGIGDAAAHAMAHTWRVQLGDWDGF